MPVLICLLRGVNLGSRNRVSMPALRELCAALGLQQPQTYLQSGNAVFLAKTRNLPRLAQQLESSIETAFGFKSLVILRTVPELRDAIQRNPFASRPAIDGKRILVTFLASAPAPDARDHALSLNPGPEELHISGREAYIYYPDGMARPKLSWPRIEKALNTTGTGRNWNTVTALLEMAEQLEART